MIRPHAQAFAAGQITAVQSLAWMWGDELAEARRLLAQHRASRLPMATDFQRREVVRLYLQTRRARVWRDAGLLAPQPEYRMAAE